MKKLKAAALMLISVLLLSGCLPHTELDKQAIVEAIGIDYADGEFNVTVQYFNMEGTGGNSPIDSSKANVINVKGKGESVTAALESASLKCGKPFMYGITGIIILGRSVLDLDILKTLSFAESYYQSNPTVLLAVADEKAEDILSVKFKEELISVEHLKMILENADFSGISAKVEILTLLREQQREYGGTVLPILKSMNVGSDATDDGKTVEIAGGCLLSGREYIGKISLSDMSGLQLLNGNMKNTLLSTEFENEKVEITAYDITLSKAHSYSKGKLIFNVKIRANGKYTDSQLSDKDASFSGAVEKKCAERLASRVRDSFINTANRYGSDACGLKYVISNSDYTEWIRVEERFGELLKNAEIIVTCDIDIDRFGIAH